MLREKYAAITADKVGRTSVSENAILLELDRAMGTQQRQPGAAAAAASTSQARLSPVQKVEREALKLLIQAPDLTADRMQELTPEHFTTPTYQKVFEVVRQSASAGTPTSQLVGAASDRGEQVQKLLAALAVEPPRSEGLPGPEFVAQVFLRLDEFALSRRIDDLRKELERLNPLKAQEQYELLFERLVDLEGARRRVRVAAEAGAIPAELPRSR